MSAAVTSSTSSDERALALIVLPGLSVPLMVTDYVLQRHEVELLGLEPDGGSSVTIKFAGSADSARSAGETAVLYARRLGVEAAFTGITRMPTGFKKALVTPNIIHPLYESREQILPNDPLRHRPNSPIMNDKPTALGILETQGLTAIYSALDTMLKAADVTVVTKEKIGAAYVTIIVQGDVAAVTAAIEAGKQAVNGFGTLVAAHIIARPHPDFLKLL
jgi:carbon dioxide concentrating mechanism protein CcmO